MIPGPALGPQGVGMHAISVRDLRKSYGENPAVRGISFDVAPGEVFGLLGANGAGKTTTIEILEGYRERTAGEVQVLGIDPARGRRAAGASGSASCSRSASSTTASPSARP